MQSLSSDWICDCRLAFAWQLCHEDDKELFPWEVAQADICRRMMDESEGNMTLDKLQKVIVRTFNAFVDAYGYGWLLALLFFTCCCIVNLVILLLV